jgi:hypothetical protein
MIKNTINIKLKTMGQKINTKSRAGGSGTYTGNHPRFTAPINMMGQVTGQMPTQMGAMPQQNIIDPTQQNIINPMTASAQPAYSAQEQIGMANQPPLTTAGLASPAFLVNQGTTIGTDAGRESLGHNKVIDAMEKKDPNKSRAERRMEKTANKTADAKVAAEKETPEEAMAKTLNNQETAAERAVRLEKRGKRQAGRAERKAIRKQYKGNKNRGERRKAIIESRQKQRK